MTMILEERLPFCIQIGRMAPALAAAERKHGALLLSVFF